VPELVQEVGADRAGIGQKSIDARTCDLGVGGPVVELRHQLRLVDRRQIGERDIPRLVSIAPRVQPRVAARVLDQPRSAVGRALAQRGSG
jgi:hypothetical protein